MNGEGKKLIECIERRGWTILNENVKGDEEEEFTYTGGRGETVIDYILGDEKVREKIERLEIGEEVDSDHQPVIAWMKGGINREEKRQGNGKIKKRGCGTRKEEEFRKELGSVNRGEEGLQEEIAEMGKKLRNTLERCEEKRGKKGQKRG